MAPSWQLEVKMTAKYIFETGKRICANSIRNNDSAGIWGFSYGFKLGIGTLKLWPAPVFSCV
jgi:hypothetical protein